MLKKFLLIVVIVVMLPLVAQAGDFRKATWGMSKAEVKKLEKSQFVEEDQFSLSYSGKIADLKCSIVYSFLDGELLNGAYYIEETYSNKNFYIHDYKKLRYLLIKKYGVPMIDEEMWSDETHRGSPKDWGAAISLGSLRYMTVWEDYRTSIDIVLDGDDGVIYHRIVYGSMEHKHKELLTSEEKKTLDDL